MRKALLLVMCFMLRLAPVAAEAMADAPTYRALLIGSEQFVTHPDTAPAATSNLRRLDEALRSDVRGYAQIRTSLNQALDAEGFGSLVRAAFSGAKEQDISLLYITTHGVYQPGEAPVTFGMVLSDGLSEYLLTAEQMYSVLKDIPGIKVLIIDSCNSGALIDRGMPGNGLQSLFTKNQFKVLTASGGSEPSFLWATGAGNVQGGSYFAYAMLSGMTPGNQYAADINRDGRITLSEMHQFLLTGYGASTPQAYPMEDDFTLYQYAPEQDLQEPALISGVVFEHDVLSRTDNILDFSYTLSARSRVVYQLVYHQKGDWQFENAQYISDADMDTGEMLAGRKFRSLRIDPPDDELSGYALMFLTTVEEDRSTPHAMKLLTVEPGSGNPALEVVVPEVFYPQKGEELAISIQHTVPLRLNVRVVDAAGKQVRTLASEQPTRPQHLPDGGSVLYWNGRLHNGEQAPQGRYHILVDCQVGGQLYTALSKAFDLQ